MKYSCWVAANKVSIFLPCPTISPIHKMLSFYNNLATRELIVWWCGQQFLWWGNFTKQFAGKEEKCFKTLRIHEIAFPPSWKIWFGSAQDLFQCMGKQVQQQNLSFPTISPPDSLLAPVEILLLSPIFTIYLLYKYATYVLSLSNLALTMFQCLQSQHSSSAKLLQSIQSSTLFNFSPAAMQWKTLNI